MFPYLALERTRCLRRAEGEVDAKKSAGPRREPTPLGYTLPVVPVLMTASTVTATIPIAAEVQVDARSVTMLAIVATMLAAAPLTAMPPAAALDLLCKRC